MQHVHLVAFRWLLAVNRRTWSYLNCLPFPNRNSDSGILYIIFKRFHLTFPVAHLDFQVEARFMHSLSNHAYALYTASRISYYVHVLVVYSVACPMHMSHVSSPLLSFFLMFLQDDHTLEITSIFACLVARSFAMPMLRYLPLAYHASHIVEPSL